MKNRDALVKSLLEHDDPSVRWRTLVRGVGEDRESRKAKKLQEEIRTSPLVKTLLSRRGRDGRIKAKYSVYDKWQGAHWVFATLADIGYPPGDESLLPMRDQIFAQWLNRDYYREFEAKSKAQAYGRHGVPVMNGRHRRCASQQGNALLSATMLGLNDSESDRLVERLLHWQWPDGGWNCDKDPKADTSSFMETILPMRALSLYGAAKGDKTMRAAARKAADVFLSRKLYRRRSDGRVIHQEFTQLHYPLYWHYDVLAGLKAMAEMRLTKDRRCGDALDLLEEKELASGGWPAERRYYKTSKAIALGNDYVDWGGTSVKKMNPWVTADALYVLREAGRG
jgi:hypothetical protein